MKKISLFIDDSGVFHSNHRFFVYAGYCFLSDEQKISAKKRYRRLNSEIKSSLKISGELKACLISKKHKNALFKVLRNEISFSVTVSLPSVQEHVLLNKKSRQRFKDYALKRIIKKLFSKLIREGLINSSEDIELYLNIDQQGFSTNGLYVLADGIVEELRYGVNNFNYGIFYEPILFGNFKVFMKVCVSENDYLIQAADILANRIWNSHEKDDYMLRCVSNHVSLNLP